MKKLGVLNIIPLRIHYEHFYFSTLLINIISIQRKFIILTLDESIKGVSEAYSNHAFKKSKKKHHKNMF